MCSAAVHGVSVASGLWMDLLHYVWLLLVF